MFELMSVKNGVDSNTVDTLSAMKYSASYKSSSRPHSVQRYVKKIYMGTERRFWRSEKYRI